MAVNPIATPTNRKPVDALVYDGEGQAVVFDASGRQIIVGAAADGAAVAGNPVLVAGQDGTNAQSLLTDSTGRQVVVGAAADGAAVAGNPVLMAGQDGTNAQSVLTDTTGRQVVVGAAADGAAVAGNPVLIAGQDGTNAQSILTDTSGKVNIAADKAEDAVHNTGDTGVFVLAVQKDTAASVAADGDYHPLETDANGRLHVVNSAVELVDDAAFTAGTSKVMPMGAMFDDSGTDSVDENDIGVPRMTATRVLLSALRGNASAEGDTSISAIANPGDGGSTTTNALRVAATIAMLNAQGTPSYDRLRNFEASNSLGSSIGDGKGAADRAILAAGVFPYRYNGTNWDRNRNNHEITALASAARTASVDSADLTNYDARGVVVVVDVTAIADSPSITVTIQGKSTLGSDYYTILASAAIVGTGQTVLRVYPGLTAIANQTVSDVLPRIWRVSVANADADSITYSVSANYIM